MLIVPLHRALTRANFPWMTFGLILVNVFVFVFLQSGDGRTREEAFAYYTDAGLARWEFPAYRAWLGGQTDAQERLALFEQLAESDQRQLALQLLQSDDRFLVELRADRLITSSNEDHAQWRTRRSEFDRRWEAAFTEHWMLRFSEFDPRRMFGAMFLHGDAGHLFGNMLFLAILGLLVEGALGPSLFLGLYLLGGFGSALTTLAWRWGDSGAALGASGAIAALMGAYCVLWGRRKVRFFWWFFVVFDYVKAPALVLLPLWLGWELANLAWNKGAHVGFDAHAGGIVSGALLALGVRALRWERSDFLDEDVIADAAIDDDAALAKAREHIGRLEIPAARELLEPLAARRPQDIEVLVALYRCARYEPRMPKLDAAARGVLTCMPRTTPEMREQKAIYDDYLKAGRVLPLTPEQQLALAARWPRIGAGPAAAALLTELIERAVSTPGLQIACLALARDLRTRGEMATAKVLLERVVATWPESVDAAKARLLLEDGV